VEQYTTCSHRSFFTSCKYKLSITNKQATGHETGVDSAVRDAGAEQYTTSTQTRHPTPAATGHRLTTAFCQHPGLAGPSSLYNSYTKLVSVVRWNGIPSYQFSVVCGFRQDGVLSPVHGNILSICTYTPSFRRKGQNWQYD